MTISLWRVEKLRGRRAEHLGMVEAGDGQASVAEAAKQSEISPALRCNSLRPRATVNARGRQG